jgi:hypothetical protein
MEALFPRQQTKSRRKHELFAIFAGRCEALAGMSPPFPHPNHALEKIKLRRQQSQVPEPNVEKVTRREKLLERGSSGIGRFAL